MSDYQVVEMSTTTLAKAVLSAPNDTTFDYAEILRGDIESVKEVVNHNDVECWSGVVIINPFNNAQGVCVASYYGGNSNIAHSLDTDSLVRAGYSSKLECVKLAIASAANPDYLISDTENIYVEVTDENREYLKPYMNDKTVNINKEAIDKHEMGNDIQFDDFDRSYFDALLTHNIGEKLYYIGSGNESCFNDISIKDDLCVTNIDIHITENGITVTYAAEDGELQDLDEDCFWNREEAQAWLDKYVPKDWSVCEKDELYYIKDGKMRISSVTSIVAYVNKEDEERNGVFICDDEGSKWNTREFGSTVFLTPEACKTQIQKRSNIEYGIDK